MKRNLLIYGLTVVTGLLALMSGGCSWLFRRDPRAGEGISATRLNEGLTLVLPGIEGQAPLNIAIRDGLVEGGVPTAIEIHEWTLGLWGTLVTEVWEGRARSKAQDLAYLIHSYKIQHPGQPVILVGHSGGCAVAVFALEKLPAGVNIDSVIMLGPSISQGYDLGPALRHIDGQAYCYYSEKDTALLGAGTFIVGTMDRKHASAAGRYGFAAPPDQKDLYAKKLKQISWDPAMAMAGNKGGHTDWANKTFVREYIARQILTEINTHIERARPPRHAVVNTQPDDTLITYRPASTTRPDGSNPASRPPATRPGSSSSPASGPGAGDGPMILPSRPH